ncbi:hypothetical protein AB205_0068340 [Aquarana catesbeiana]|uniref:Uncharacterized protein n=1 Tax=Aquarana catesbeiana TaxID=8400 RepID=A0A2G9QDP0_AQUCT|nr:hypothetical protein AB205_0068340 [Aquarana catesbeiana]
MWRERFMKIVKLSPQQVMWMLWKKNLISPESAQILIRERMGCNRNSENIKENINDVQKKLKNIIDVLKKLKNIIDVLGRI